MLFHIWFEKILYKHIAFQMNEAGDTGQKIIKNLIQLCPGQEKTFDGTTYSTVHELVSAKGEKIKLKSNAFQNSWTEIIFIIDI